MLIPVLLSGGVGSRLWPVSRELYPKQFLPLVDSKASLLQQTTARLDGLDCAAPVVVCNEEHRFLVAEQLRSAGIDGASIILEPSGRNTAPAVALAALQAENNGAADAVLLVLPADHIIEDAASFRDVVQAGTAAAATGHLVTFGIVPQRPETGYGYIRRGGPQSSGVFAIDAFVEKPDQATAERYLASGDYFWNSGMFMFRADTYLEQLETHAPDILDAVRRSLSAAAIDLDFIRPDGDAFAACRSDSLDYAVMERTDRGVVLPLDAGWSDVGAWSAIWETQPHDDHGNAVRGDVILHDVENSYLRSDSRLLAAVGVHDIVVVETADAVLVADRNRVQDVKAIVKALKEGGRPEASSHTRVYRPWGSYESLVVSERFQVKLIIVNPGESLSLQMHHHRAEHWIVVNGTAMVRCNGEEFLLGEDQSTYIPLGHRHRLTNPGVIPLEIIEVQTGSYLGEDDIVRFEDVYGRVGGCEDGEKECE